MVICLLAGASLNAASMWPIPFKATGGQGFRAGRAKSAGTEIAWRKVSASNYSLFGSSADWTYNDKDTIMYDDQGRKTVEIKTAVQSTMAAPGSVLSVDSIYYDQDLVRRRVSLQYSRGFVYGYSNDYSYLSGGARIEFVFSLWNNDKLSWDPQIRQALVFSGSVPSGFDLYDENASLRDLLAISAEERDTVNDRWVSLGQFTRDNTLSDASNLVLEGNIRDDLEDEEYVARITLTFASSGSSKVIRSVNQRKSRGTGEYLTTSVNENTSTLRNYESFDYDSVSDMTVPSHKNITHLNAQGKDSLEFYMGYDSDAANWDTTWAIRSQYTYDEHSNVIELVQSSYENLAYEPMSQSKSIFRYDQYEKSTPVRQQLGGVQRVSAMSKSPRKVTYTLSGRSVIGLARRGPGVYVSEESKSKGKGLRLRTAR